MAPHRRALPIVFVAACAAQPTPAAAPRSTPLAPVATVVAQIPPVHEVGPEAPPWRPISGPARSTTAGDPCPTTPRGWKRITTVGAPSLRGDYSTVWTGSKLLILGGWPDGRTGGAYDPCTDKWSRVPFPPMEIPAFARGMRAVELPRAFVADRKVFFDGHLDLDGGAAHLPFRAIYDADTNRWKMMSTAGAPAVLFDTDEHVWTGDRFIVWGGWRARAIYDPATDSWTDIAMQGAPAPAMGARAVWIGDRLAIVGGVQTPCIARECPPGESAIYDPTTRSWSSMTAKGRPTIGSFAEAQWTGDRLVVAGEADAAFYDPKADVWTPIAPSNTKGATIWTGTHLLRLAHGLPPGGSYDAATNAWRESPQLLFPQGDRFGRQELFWLDHGRLIFADAGHVSTFDAASMSFDTKDLPASPLKRAARYFVWTGKRLIGWGGQAEVPTGKMSDNGCKGATGPCDPMPPMPLTRREIYADGAIGTP